MKNSDDTYTNNVINDDEFNKFIEAKTFKEKIKILTIHSENNQKNIENMMNMENYKTSYVTSQEEISKQFEEFCNMKGIKAKFKVVFSQMKENIHYQHAQNKANLEATKNSKVNQEFKEFLHTKGFKAKCRLVIENIKKGAKNANADTAIKIDELNKKTKASINTHIVHSDEYSEYSAKQLSEEFNVFLKEHGLDEKYSVEIVEE